MVQAICNFCGKFAKTYKCRIVGMDMEVVSCRKCVRTHPIQLVPMEEFNEDEAESEQEVEKQGL